MWIVNFLICYLCISLLFDQNISNSCFTKIKSSSLIVIQNHKEKNLFHILIWYLLGFQENLELFILRLFITAENKTFSHLKNRSGEICWCGSIYFWFYRNNYCFRLASKPEINIYMNIFMISISHKKCVFLKLISRWQL